VVDSSNTTSPSPSLCRLWNHYAPETEPFSNTFCFWKHEACCEPYSGRDCSLLFEDVYRPVSCGVSQCAYDNLCLANSVGWNDNECQDRCPDKNPVSDSSQCSDQAYNPVSCQPHQDNDRLTCVYDNSCTASASGVVDVASDQVCELKCPPESRQVDCAPSCTREYDPHVCGLGKCEYSNQCTSTAGAGFLVEQCYHKFPVKEESRGLD
jgi:hypothetical protein